MAATPPLPPEAGIREDAPPSPEQIPGSGEPIVPPQGDVTTGQPQGIQMTNVWDPQQVLPKLDSVLETGLSPHGLTSPGELEDQLVKQGYDPKDAQEVANRVMGLEMTAAAPKGIGELIGKIFRGGNAEEAAQRVMAGKTVKPGPLGQTPLEPNWNSARVSTDALQEDLNKFINTYKDDYEAIRGGRTDLKTEAMLEKAMEKRYGDVMKVLNIPGKALTEIQTRATLSYLQAGLEEYDKVLKRVQKGDAQAIPDLTKQTALVQALMYKLIPARREAGATLRAYGQQVADLASGHAIMDAAELTKAVEGIDVDPTRLANILGSMGKDARLRVLAQNARRRLINPGPRTTRDEIASLYIDSLLLGGGVQVRNTMGNLFRAATFIPERMVEGQVGRLSMALGSKDIHYIPGEATEMTLAIPQAVMSAFAALGHIRATGESKFYGKKIDMDSYRNILQRETMPLAIQRLGHFWATGSRGLFYADEASKMFIYEMEKAAAVYRYSKLLAETPEAQQALYGRLLANTPQAIVDEAMESAAVGTMTAPGGKFMQWGQDTANLANPVSRMIVPFVSATGNMAKQSYQRTPILNIISYEHWNAVAKGGRKADAAYARMGSGLLLGSAFAAMAMNGTITGSGEMWSPEYRAAKIEQGWKPCSLVVAGAPPINLKNVGPWGSAACATADMVEAWDYLGKDDAYKVAQMFGQAYGTMLADSAFAGSIADFFKAMNSKDADTIIKFVNRSMTGFIPAGAREIADIIEPGKAITDAKGDIFDSNLIAKELGQLSNEIVRKTPIAKGSLLPLQRGPIEGEVLTNSVLYGQYKGATPKGEVVVNKLTDSVPFSVFNIQESIGGSGQVVRPGQPGLPARVPGVTILPEDEAELYRLRGTLKLDGKRLVDALYETVNDPEWQALSKGPGGGREKWVKKLVQAYTKEAFADFDAKYKQPAYPGGGPGGLLEQKATVKERKAQRKAGEE